MTALISFIRRHPLLIFFILAFAFSWWGWPLYHAHMSPVPIFSPGPCVAAFVVTALTAGRLGVRDLVQRMLRWRVGLRWYAVALALPALIAATAALFNTVFGATPRWPVQIDGWTDLALTFALNLLVPAFGGAWEEPGWRGYLLPQLLPLGQWPALLISGAIWGLWHAPIIAGGYNYPGFPILGIVEMCALTTAFALTQTALRIRYRSVYLTSFFHASVNASGLGVIPMFVLGVSPVVGGITGVVGVAAFGALGIVLLARTGAGGRGDVEVSRC